MDISSHKYWLVFGMFQRWDIAYQVDGTSSLWLILCMIRFRWYRSLAGLMSFILVPSAGTWSSKKSEYSKSLQSLFLNRRLRPFAHPLWFICILKHCSSVYAWHVLCLTYCIVGIPGERIKRCHINKGKSEGIEVVYVFRTFMRCSYRGKINMTSCVAKKIVHVTSAYANKEIVVGM